MKYIKVAVLVVTLLCILTANDVSAENAKLGDGHISCNLDGSTTDKGVPFSKANLNVTGIDTSGNYIYKGIMFGVFKKGETEWTLLLSNSILTDSASIEVTDFGNITTYEYNTVYSMGYKILYESIDGTGPIVSTDWNIIDGSYFKVVTIVLPTLDTVEINGTRTYGEDVTLNGTGTNIREAAYRIYYTTSITAPLVEDNDKDGNPDGWFQPTPEVRESMLVDGDTKISKTVSGDNLSDITWTYVTFKVAVASSTGIWVWKFTPPYSLGGSGAGGGGGGSYLNYVGHNQIIESNGKTIVLTAPDTPDPTYGPYDDYVMNNLFGINKSIDGDYLKYRLEFDVVNYEKIKDIKVLFYFNSYNERNVEIQPVYMKLVKRQPDGSFAVLKDLVYTAQGVNRYVVALGNDNWGNPMIVANQGGRYAIEYRAILKVRADIEDTLVTITNEAQIRTCVGTGRYDEIIEPDRPSNKFYINTKVTRLNVIYR